MDVGYGLNKDNFILKLPAEGYHAYDGKVKVFNEVTNTGSGFSPLL